MKKITSLLIAIFIVVLCCATFFACNKSEFKEEAPIAINDYYSLEEVYENGWIDKQILMSIAYYHSPQHNEFDANFVPTPIDTAELNAEIQAIILEYAREEHFKYTPVTIVEESYKIRKYLGMYNGIIVCEIQSRDEPGTGITPVSPFINIDGVVFSRSLVAHILCFKISFL